MSNKMFDYLFLNLKSNKEISGKLILEQVDKKDINTGSAWKFDGI